MKNGRRGFTLIEVSLFLAISGLLFFGVTIGVQTSIRQQRYNDSVQSFAEFLRNVYAEVLNVQNVDGNNGRSDRAIYGKLVTFGEGEDALGNSNTDAIFVYNVVGPADASGVSGTALKQLQELKANVVQGEPGATTTIGAAWSYTPKWGARIENADRSVYSGSVLIVRNPSSGIINTYASGDVFEVNNGGTVSGFVTYLSNSGFESKQIDFCVNPEPGSNGNLRRNVRIVQGARNTSGVEIVADNGGDNKCKKD